MSRNRLTRVRPGSASWWLYLLLMGYFGIAPLVYLLVEPFGGWEVGAGIGFSLLCLAVTLNLALRHPKLARRATDDQGFLRMWVSGSISGLIGLAFAGIAITGALAPQGPLWAMVAIGGVLALLMAVLFVKITLGGHKVSGGLFGIRRQGPGYAPDGSPLDQDDVSEGPGHRAPGDPWDAAGPETPAGQAAEQQWFKR